MNYLQLHLPKDIITYIFDFEGHWKLDVYKSVMKELTLAIDGVKSTIRFVENFGYSVDRNNITPLQILSYKHIMTEYRRSGRLYCHVFRPLHRIH